MLVKQLKLELKARGASAVGNKPVLQGRLIELKDLLERPVQDTRNYCGCLNTDHGLVIWLRNANMKLLIEGGTRRDPAWYREKLNQLFVCLTTNTHDGACVCDRALTHLLVF